jgi:hypothetical protein
MLLELLNNIIVSETGGPPTTDDEKVRPEGIRVMGSWQAAAPFNAKQILP